MNIFFASSAVQVVTQRVSETWPWYVVRGAGFVAAGLIILLMLSGIGQVTGLTYRFIAPIKAWAIHKAMAIALCVAIAVHIIFLLFDHFIHFSLIQILFPFASHYTNGTKFMGLPIGGIAVTLGILAMYGVAIIVASSLGWINKRQKTWRSLHYLSYFVIFFIFLHALYVGSDLKYGLFRQTWILLGALVLLAVAIRLWRAGTLKRGRQK